MKEGWLRRRILWYLRRDHVNRMKQARTGECARCGRCCHGCPAFKKSEKTCRVYSIRPNICRNFPLTPDDIEDMGTCGFSFEDLALSGGNPSE